MPNSYLWQTVVPEIFLGEFNVVSIVTELAMLCLTILMAWEQILAVRIAFRTLLGNRS